MTNALDWNPGRDSMVSSPESSWVEALDHVQEVWERMKDKSPIYQYILTDVQLLAASSTGSVNASLLVKPVHLNSKGTLHGTISACLIDWAGGMAIAATGMEKTGSSTDMHISFVSAAKEGDTLRIKSTASKVGGTLAFTSVEISKAADHGEVSVVATGSHTKYVK